MPAATASRLAIRNAGTADHPIRFKAFADDAVLMDGADEIPAAKWQPLPGSKTIFFLPAEFDPGQVLVDGKQIFVKVNKLRPYEWELGKLGEQGQKLLPIRRHRQAAAVEPWRREARQTQHPRPRPPERISARRELSPVGHSGRALRLRSLRASSATTPWSRIAWPSIAAAASASAAGTAAAPSSAAIRSSAPWAAASISSDRPTGCLVEDNLVINASRNPWHLPLWLGSIKMNSAADTVFANNVVVDAAGNPDTIDGWDGWSLWGDINIVRIMYLGNVTAHTKHAGLYIECAMGDTRAYFNTSYHDGGGITCRASQRGVFMRNYVESPRGSGLAVWHADEPYPAVDNVFAHNLVRQSETSLHMQTEHPNFFDYNVYWPRKGSRLADGEDEERQDAGV